MLFSLGVFLILCVSSRFLPALTSASFFLSCLPYIDHTVFFTSLRFSSNDPIPAPSVFFLSRQEVYRFLGLCPADVSKLDPVNVTPLPDIPEHKQINAETFKVISQACFI